MDVIFKKPEGGFEFNEDNALTLKFDPSVRVQKLESGIYIPKDGFGQGLDGTVDNWTIVPLINKENNSYQTNTNGRNLIGVNLDHVVCIYSMSRKKVTQRTINGYRCSNETKTVQDVMDEFNCAMDIGVPPGLPFTSYKMTPGDLFQFREEEKPWFAKNDVNGNTWPCMMDDMNRYETQVTLALFYVTEVEYNLPSNSFYMTKLSLKCVWKETNDSKFAAYDIGQTYTAIKSI